MNKLYIKHDEENPRQQLHTQSVEYIFWDMLSKVLTLITLLIEYSHQIISPFPVAVLYPYWAKIL